MLDFRYNGNIVIYDIICKGLSKFSKPTVIFRDIGLQKKLQNKTKR